jgi:hypothetical protein
MKNMGAQIEMAGRFRELFTRVRQTRENIVYLQ